MIVLLVKLNVERSSDKYFRRSEALLREITYSGTAAVASNERQLFGSSDFAFVSLAVS